MRLIPRVRMPRPEPPCRPGGADCPRRKVGCHSECQEYKEFREARKEQHKKLYHAVAEERQVDGLLIEAALKVQGKKKPER